MGYIRQGAVDLGVGKLVSAAEKYLTPMTEALSAAKNVLEDPALGEVTRIVLDLHKMEQPARPGAPSPPVKGIGLSRIVKPLKMYRYTRQNPWVVPLGVAAVIGVPFLLGLVMGRRRR